MRKNIKFFYLFLFIIFQNNNVQAWLFGTEILSYRNLTGHMADTLTDLRYGFSISDGVAKTRTKLPVGKMITFGKQNAVLELISDLNLDTSVTLSFWVDAVEGNKGYISGNGNTLFLNGDLLIPDNCSLEILSDIQIDGNDKKLIFGDNSGFIVDSNVTLTLKNIKMFTGENDGNPSPIRVCTDGNLALQGVTLTLGDNFLFDDGYLFIHDDVLVRGLFEFIYSSTQGCKIDSYSTLKFDLETLFTYSPYSDDNNLIKMEDRTSTLFLNGASLQMTSTGLRLTKGNLIFDKNVTVSFLPIDVDVFSVTSFDEKINLSAIKKSLSYPVGTDNAYGIKFSNDAKFVAYGGQITNILGYGKVARINFDGSTDDVTTNFTYTGRIFGLNFSSEGNYLGVGGDSYINYGFAKLYPFLSNGALNNPTTIPTQGKTEWVTFSNDGKYIGVGCDDISPDPSCFIYPINPDYTLGTSIEIPYYDQVFVVDFSPDSGFIAVAGMWNDGSGNYSQIYPIWPDGTIGSANPVPYGNNARTLQFSPDGRYLVVGGTAANKLIVCSIDSNGCVESFSTIAYPNEVYSVSFSPDGTELYVGGAAGLYIYPFDLRFGFVGTPNKRYSYSGAVEDIDFSPDQSKIAVGGWWANNYAVLYNYFQDYGGNTQTNYSFGNVNNPYSSYCNGLLIFGDELNGAGYNLYVDFLPGTRVSLYGKIDVQNVS
ncbi:MAG: hypothetical protein ABIA74_00025 [bacterium]